MGIKLREKKKTGVNQSAIQKGLTHTFAKKPNGKNKTGRPDKYNDAVARHICKELTKGRTLTRICGDDEGMPHISTVMAWKQPKDVRFNQEFLELYTLAREAQAEVIADMCDDIANDGRNDTYIKIDEKTGKRTRMIDYDVLGRSALRIKTKQWNAKYLFPSRFGDKVKTEITGADGKDFNPIVPVLTVNFIGKKKEQE